MVRFTVNPGWHTDAASLAATLEEFVDHAKIYFDGIAVEYQIDLNVVTIPWFARDFAYGWFAANDAIVEVRESPVQNGNSTDSTPRDRATNLIYALADIALIPPSDDADPWDLIARTLCAAAPNGATMGNIAAELRLLAAQVAAGE